MGMDSGSSDFKADINVTPLVDVCLVLLIIFMVVTPMLKAGIAVQLPKSKNGEEMQEADKEHVVLTMKDDGSIYVEGELVPGGEMKTPEGDEAVESAMRLALQQAKNKPLLIKADARLKYGDVKRVMDIAKEKIPLRSLRLAADRIKSKAGGD